MHSSALFANSGGERQELHMPALRPILFDPAEPDLIFDDKIQNMFDELTNPEAYESIEGSGWTIIPDTLTFWVNTIRYQPNNNADENSRNCFSPDTNDDPDDPAITDDIASVLNDTFLLSLAAHHVPRRNHHTRVLYRRQCEKWVNERGHTPQHGTPKITPSTLATWHEAAFDYHIRIFSASGNVIYHAKYPPDSSAEVINLLWKNKKFSLILNLWTLLHEKRDRHFCNACKKFHSNEELCKHSLKPARSEKIKVPELPPNRHHCVIYADFESFIRGDNHQPSGYCLVMIVDNQIAEKRIVNYIQATEIAEHFIKTVVQLCKDYTYTDKKSGLCGICDLPVTGGSYLQARNYINGREGYHHLDCFEDIRNCAFILFHNFRGYDSHYVLSEAIRHCDVQTLRGKSFEKFDLIKCVSQIFARFTFKDSFNFFPYSLANLVKQIKNWRYTPTDARHSKGVFPYDWFDNPDKLNSPSLPPKDEWFNKVTQSYIDNTEAEKIWREKNFTSFAEYHNYYMEIDVLQLADAFEEFRDAVINEFKTDPIYCQGAPSLTWQLCLQLYAERIKLITDMSIYIDIQANIRGGISQVMTRHVDVRKKGGSILYLDINSLYSTCMMDKMPTSLVAKINELPPDWEQKFASNGEYCALFNVDLHYPEHLHDKHRFYPLAPHKFNNRLCATFLDKEDYLLHSNNLKYYLDNGLILIKFNYGYVFKQDYILKDYVNSNIEKRKQASRDENPVLTNLYKLLNNSLYGKTCENKFKYRKYAVKDPFVGIWGKHNPFLFKSRNWMEIENKILCEQDNTSITLDKPIQIGFTVLEFAKLKIYQFYYSLMHYFPEVELIYTDTDSLMMWFPYENPQYKLIDSPMCKYFDFEKTPDWFGVRTVATDKVSGLWSLEADKPIVQFVGLRAKTYAIEFADGTTTLKNKGIIKTAVEEETKEPLDINRYLECLYSDKDIYIEQYLIRSKLHQISTVSQRKLALSNSDEKRVILADKVTTLPYGYKGEIFHDNSVIQPSDDNL